MEIHFADVPGRGHVITCVVSGREFAKIKALPWKTDWPSALVAVRGILSPSDFDAFVAATAVAHDDLEWTTEL